MFIKSRGNTNKSAKKKLYFLPLVLLMLLTSVGTTLVQYKAVYADEAQDLRIYNKLVGFKMFCGLDGGGDSKVTEEDVKKVFDATNGDNGNAAAISGGHEDQGASIIVGYNASPTLNGVVSCNGAAVDVMTVVMSKFGGEAPADEEQARQWLVLFLSKEHTYNEAAKIIKKGGDNANPWFDKEKVELENSDPWGKFVRTILQDYINAYAKRMRAFSKASITKLMLPALNYCFNWVNTKPTNAVISYPSDKLWAIRPPSGYNDTRFYKTYNDENYEKGDKKIGTGEENAQIRSLKLTFKGIPDDLNNKADPSNERWYTLGYASEHMLSGVSAWNDKDGDNRSLGGLVSCNELITNKSIFSGNLKKSGDGVTLSDDAAKEAGDDGIETTTGTDADVGAETDEASCNASINPATWAICPIVNGIGDLIDWMFDSFILPLLKISPVTTTPDGSMFKAWSGFRLVANIMLVIVFLLMIFGQAIGGGLVDAYTVKKVMPRVVIGAIGINLSIYLVAIMVDITNVLGGGVADLLVTPFQLAKDKQDGGYSPGNLSGIITLIIVLLATFGVWKVLSKRGPETGRFKALRSSVFGRVGKKVWMPFLLFIGIPAIVGFVSVFVTLILRTGIIMIAAVTAPAAIALWILPSTEKYFKKWWDLFVKALLVYPIVMILFAMGDIVAYAFGGGLLEGGKFGINGIVAIFAQLIPLFMIGYAFKIAGGILGSIHQAVTKGGKQLGEAIKGNPNDPDSLRNNAKRGLTNALRNERAAYWHANYRKERKTGGDKRSDRARHAMSGFIARQVVGRGNVQRDWSKMQKEAAERHALETGYGPDDLRRASIAVPLLDGEGHHVTNEHGQLMYRSISDPNKLYDERQVAEARRFTDEGDMQMMTKDLEYEAKKAVEDGNIEDFYTNTARLFADRGLSKEQAALVYQGVAFGEQQHRLGMKHRSLRALSDDDGNITGFAFDPVGGLATGTDSVTGAEASRFEDLSSFVPTDPTKLSDEAKVHQKNMARMAETNSNLGSWQQSTHAASDIADFEEMHDSYLEAYHRAEDGSAEQQQAAEMLMRIRDNNDYVMRTDRGISTTAARGEEGEPDATVGGLAGAPAAVQVASERLHKRIEASGISTAELEAAAGRTAPLETRASRAPERPPAAPPTPMPVRVVGGQDGVDGSPVDVRPPAAPPTPPAAPRIITPDDDDFSIPPGSRP